MPSPHLFATPALAVAALALAGCGGTVIDYTKAADTIQASLESTQHVKIKSVDCPSGVDVDPGTTFTCAVNAEGGKHAIVTLKIRNKDADVTIVGLEPKL